jgi:plasmid stability protein
MTRRLTVRGVPDEVARKLKEISRATGRSVNATVLEILSVAVGVDQRRQRFQRLATWTQEDAREFEEALRSQRTIDEKAWS